MSCLLSCLTLLFSVKQAHEAVKPDLSIISCNTSNLVLHCHYEVSEPARLWIRTCLSCRVMRLVLPCLAMSIPGQQAREAVDPDLSVVVAQGSRGTTLNCRIAKEAANFVDEKYCVWLRLTEGKDLFDHFYP